MGAPGEHHADFSNFSSGSTKEESYILLLESAKALFVDTDGSSLPAISNLANASALLWGLFSEISPSINWAGFYIRHPSKDASKKDQLTLGPFQGKVACQVISFGKGVCGTAASTKETQLVPDVHEFPGHIACDAASNSEIVVPIILKSANNGSTGSNDSDIVVAVMDIDSSEKNTFDLVDKKYLEEFAALIAENTNWGQYI